MDYPNPNSSCAQIWIEGDDIFLLCPGDVRGHTVKQTFDFSVLTKLCSVSQMPVTVGEKTVYVERLSLDERRTLRALGAILQVLRERAQASAFTIGNKSSPTQYDLDIIMKALGEGRVTKVGPKRRADDSLTLADLDL